MMHTTADSAFLRFTRTASQRPVRLPRRSVLPAVRLPAARSRYTTFQEIGPAPLRRSVLPDRFSLHDVSEPSGGSGAEAGSVSAPTTEATTHSEFSLSAMSFAAGGQPSNASSIDVATSGVTVGTLASMIGFTVSFIGSVMGAVGVAMNTAGKMASKAINVAVRGLNMSAIADVSVISAINLTPSQHEDVVGALNGLAVGTSFATDDVDVAQTLANIANAGNAGFSVYSDGQGGFVAMATTVGAGTGNAPPGATNFSESVNTTVSFDVNNNVDLDVDPTGTAPGSVSAAAAAAADAAAAASDAAAAASAAAAADASAASAAAATGGGDAGDGGDGGDGGE